MGEDHICVNLRTDSYAGRVTNNEECNKPGVLRYPADPDNYFNGNYGLRYCGSLHVEMY